MREGLEGTDIPQGHITHALGGIAPRRVCPHQLGKQKPGFGVG
jgi:hypothetical protein